MNTKRDNLTATERFELDRLEKALVNGPVLDLFYKILPVPPTKIFECASGTGLDVAIPLALAGHDVVASEYTQSAQEDLKRLSIRYGAQIRIVPIDFSSLALPDQESFDYIFARYCLQHHQSLKALEDTIRLFQDHTNRRGEHRFSCLTNHQMKSDDYWTPIPNISSLPRNIYLKLFSEVYTGWDVSIEYTENVFGIWYLSASERTDARHDILRFSARSP